MDTKECWSCNNEDFIYDDLGTLMECHGDELQPGDVIWRGTAKHPSISILVDAGSVIEDIAERAFDFGGEYAEDYPEVTPEHKAKLQAFLEQWLAECPSPSFYQVTDSKPYTLTRGDFAGIAQREEGGRT